LPGTFTSGGGYLVAERERIGELHDNEKEEGGAIVATL
jgi:hypothetical protein